jgi:hypothetical protein
MQNVQTPTYITLPSSTNSALFPNLRKQTAPKTKKKKLWDDEMEQTRGRKKENVSSLLPKTDKQHKQKKEK